MDSSTTRPSHSGALRIERPGKRAIKNQYQVLFAQLRTMGYGTGSLKTIGITSSQRREGVTTIACNLALYAASRQNLSVLIVDANVSNPQLHRMFEVPQSPGFTELLNEGAIEPDCINDLSLRPLKSWPAPFRRSFRRAMGRSRSANRGREPLPAPMLSVLSIGGQQLQATEYLEPDNAGFLEPACAEFDLVIVDLPAISSATFGFSLANLDGVLMVLEAERTPDLVAQKSLHQIGAVGANVVGVALNKCRTHLPKWIDNKLGV